MQNMFPPAQSFAQEEINKALFDALEKIHKDVIQATASNEVLYEHVGSLRDRVNTLEEENGELRARLDGSRVDQHQPRPMAKLKEKTRPKLSLAIDGLNLNGGLGGSFNLPTPSTVCSQILLLLTRC